MIIAMLYYNTLTFGPIESLLVYIEIVYYFYMLVYLFCLVYDIRINSCVATLHALFICLYFIFMSLIYYVMVGFVVVSIILLIIILFK